jgi:hypothetical protein
MAQRLKKTAKNHYIINFEIYFLPEVPYLCRGALSLQENSKVYLQR